MDKLLVHMYDGLARLERLAAQLNDILCHIS